MARKSFLAPQSDALFERKVMRVILLALGICAVVFFAALPHLRNLYAFEGTIVNASLDALYPPRDGKVRINGLGWSREHSPQKLQQSVRDMAALSGLLQQYRIEHGKFPTTAQGLPRLWLVAKWQGQCSQGGVPLDPWGNGYIYETPGPNGSDFLITSYGADGVQDGDGANADIKSE